MRNMKHALRLYLSPVFFRENYAFLTGVTWSTVAFIMAFQDHATTHWQNGIFKLPESFSLWWWLGLQGLVASGAMHYWRQVRSPLASMTPGMIAAEYKAIHVVLAFIMLLMAVPLLYLGAPLLNILAQESLSLALSVNSDTATPKALRGPIRLFRALLLMGVFVLFLFPQVQERLLSLPWYIALGLLVVGTALTVIELAHTPRPTVGQEGAGQQSVSIKAVSFRGRSKGKPSRSVEAAPSSQDAAQRGSGLIRVMLWQFPWLRNPPVPNTMMSPGPVGYLAGCVLAVVSIFIMHALLEVLQTFAVPNWAALKKSMLMAPQLICIMSVSGLASWMQVRADWPFLLNLAGYGTRLDFARALYATHAKRTVQNAVFATVICSPLGIFLAGLHWSRLPVTLLAIFCIVVGIGYLPSLGLIFSPRKNRPALTQLLTAGGSIIGVQLALGLLFSHHAVPVWALVVMVAGIPFSAVMAWLAPQALAKADWPIEPAAP